MMANVSGVSQFLETVGVQGPQAAAESAPGRDFAAVMQKAGDEAGSPLPQPSNGSGPGQAEEDASGTGAAASTQTSTQGAQKIISQAASTPTAASAPSFRRVYVGGQTPGGGTLGAARSSQLATQVAADALSSTAAPSMAEGIVASTDLVATLKVAAPGPDAAGPQVAATTTQENNVIVPLAAAPGAVSKGAPINSVQPQPTIALKPADATAASTGNTPAKPAAAKVDAKETALIPQGTADVPQRAAGLPVAESAAPVVLTVPVIVPVADSPRTVEGTAQQNATPEVSSTRQKPVIAAGPTPAAGAVPGATGKQTSNVKGAFGGGLATPAATASATMAGSAASASQGASLSNSEAPQSAAVMTATAPVPAGNAVSQAPQAAPLVTAVSGASAVRNTPTTQAAAPADASPAASPDQSNTVVPAALNANGPAQPTAKPGARVSGALRTAKVAGDPALAVDPASSPAAPAKAAASAAGTGPAPLVAPAQPSAGHAATAASSVKAAPRPADVAVSSPTAPAPAPQAGSVKPAVAADSISATSTGKDSSSAAAPLVSSPAVAAPAEMVAVVSTAAAMAPQAPLVHGTAASAPVMSGVAGAGFGAQEASATASGSLPHTTLSSTPTSLEVGVSSGTHGWLKIRAELNEAGQVDASLTGANAAAASKLRGDLPALNSYLQGEKVQMGSLDVRSALHSAAFESGSTFSQAGSGGGSNPSTGTAVSADASAAEGRGQQAPQQEANAVPVLDGGRDGDEVLLGRVADAAAYGNQTELGGNEVSPLAGYGAGGGWLNVRV